MALTKNIGQLPMELLSNVFSHVDDQKSIRESRLVSRRFKDASTSYLTKDITVCMRSESLAALEELSDHPTYSKIISGITIVLSFFDTNMAADRALYMRNCETRLFQRLEILDRGGRFSYRIRDDEAKLKIMEEVVSKLWEVESAHEITNTSADGFDEASATPIQKFVLRLHAMYKERCDDQEQVRQGNEHIKRICAALRKLPSLTKVELEDRPYLVHEELQESDFEDLGLSWGYLEHFDSAIAPSQFCGSFETAYSVRPPLEMVGELVSQLGRSGMRPETVAMRISTPANLRRMALTPEQQAGVRELVSKATDLSLTVDGWARKGSLAENNDRPRDEMLALCSLTQPYFDAPRLESLYVYFVEYPRFYETPTVSLTDLLPLQKPWPQLISMDLRYLPAHLEEVRALVAQQGDTVTSFKWYCAWLLSGRWDQAVEALRGFPKLKKISLDYPRGERYSKGNGPLPDVPYDEIYSYILKKTDANPLPEVPPEEEQ